MSAKVSEVHFHSLLSNEVVPGLLRSELPFAY